MSINTYIHRQAFKLELGGALDPLAIGYHTYGELNDQKDNVVWVFHALTANSDATDWWPGMIGQGCPIDTDHYFVVCANIIGSCYGSTGPKDEHFPDLTMRDLAAAHQSLATHLEIDKIALGIGGSMGGYQLMEWALASPDLFERITLLATSSKESTWGKAIHATQRMALESGEGGVAIARAIGMLSYRSPEILELQQSDDAGTTKQFKVESYLRYQGKKLADRFSTHSYKTLSLAMDRHEIGRGRMASEEELLSSISGNILVIGISSDQLCPVSEQKTLANKMSDATYVEIDSPYGHDGFLVEVDQIGPHVAALLAQ